MMQNCPKCQQPNRPEAKFCAACGTTLGQSAPEALPETLPPAPPTPEPSALPPGKVPCPRCGKTVAARAKFCNYCGQSLAAAAAPVLAAASAPDAEPQLTVPPPPAVAANEQAAEPVGVSPAPAAQPSEQIQPVPAMTSTPPPYSPPAYTPKQQKISRSQKIIMLVTGGVVALILLTLIIVAFGGASPVLPTPTGAAAPMVTPSLPLVSPIASDTAAPRQTSTPRVVVSPLPLAQDTEEIRVLPGDGILDVVARYCAGNTNWSTERLMDYALRIAETNGIPWNDGKPIIHPGEVLRVPPCPR